MINHVCTVEEWGGRQLSEQRDVLGCRSHERVSVRSPPLSLSLTHRTHTQEDGSHTVSCVYITQAHTHTRLIRHTHTHTRAHTHTHTQDAVLQAVHTLTRAHTLFVLTHTQHWLHILHCTCAHTLTSRAHTHTHTSTHARTLYCCCTQCRSC